MDEEKRYDVEAVKSRLKEYVENERDIDNQIERLEHLIARLEGLGPGTHRYAEGTERSE